MKAILSKLAMFGIKAELVQLLLFAGALFGMVLQGVIFALMIGGHSLLSVL